MEDIDATIAWLAARSLSGAKAWVEALDATKAAVVWRRTRSCGRKKPFG
jgi:hypothetical protein